MANTDIPQTVDDVIKWIQHNQITEVECLVPDMNGLARGKILPADKFTSGLQKNALALSDSVFFKTVTGWEADNACLSDGWGDGKMIPDLQSIRLVPWIKHKKVAQILCDMHTKTGEKINLSPRQVLQNVLAKYDEMGLKPVVAPELEFYYIAQNTDPNEPLQPPVGVWGRAESGVQGHGVDALREHDPFVETVTNYARECRLDMDGFIHEYGQGQLEINLKHGNPLHMADQAFLFKRMVRQSALEHGHYATFMARPFNTMAGSSMHIHQSVVDAKTGENIFADGKTGTTDAFDHYLGGMQKYMLDGALIILPYVNSYRRMGATEFATPINLEWGIDNRTAGFRVPNEFGMATRVENRLAGTDVNPYLLIALTLATGLLGMQNKITPRKQVTGDVAGIKENIPTTVHHSIALMKNSDVMADMLGQELVDMYTKIKQKEIDLYDQIITPWEREYLLLGV